MKILYIHGLSSSGSSNTPKLLRKYLPEAEVLSPDLPTDIADAVAMLKEFVAYENVDVVVGTSMGGMLAQKLRGYRKILVNPSFHLSQSMRRCIGVNQFFSAREDGATEYTITEQMCDRSYEIEQCQFEDLPDSEIDNTAALFGMHDDVVDCRLEYLEHYKNIHYFNGGHRLDEQTIAQILVPMICDMAAKDLD